MNKWQLLTHEPVPNEPGAFIPMGTIGTQVGRLLGCGCHGNPFRYALEVSILDRSPIVIEVNQINLKRWSALK